jgi:Leucine-rich repeat (LRR) protein
LEAVYCFNSKITSLPDLPKIRKIFAQNTPLAAIPDNYFRVEMMNIDATDVASIPETMISLRWLSANNTKLVSISDKLLSLEWLSIEHTSVDAMPHTMLSLQFLNCSHSGVQDICVDHYRCLRKLVCRGCPIDPFVFTNGLDVMM